MRCEVVVRIQQSNVRVRTGRRAQNAASPARDLAERPSAPAVDTDGARIESAASEYGR
jgi:hypothetical protein